MAALALGAEGVLMGTRFMATKECPLHPRVKQWMIEAQHTDTLIVGRSRRNVTRCMKTEFAERVCGIEARGASSEEAKAIMFDGGMSRAQFEGDLNAGMIPCGQAVGLIDELPSVKEVIDSIIEGARTIGERLYYLSR